MQVHGVSNRDGKLVKTNIKNQPNHKLKLEIEPTYKRIRPNILDTHHRTETLLSRGPPPLLQLKDEDVWVDTAQN